MHNIKENFDKILVALKDILKDEINENGNYARRGSVPSFSDIEVIAMSLTADCLGIDSENYLFSKLSVEYASQLNNLVGRRRYNDRQNYCLIK